MKHAISYIWNNHAGPFIGYLAAFIAPSALVIISLQLVVLSQWLTGGAAARKKGEEKRYHSFASILIKGGVYVFIVLQLRVCEIAFLEGTKIPLANIMGGYFFIRELKVNIDNASVIFGYDVWEAIVKAVNKIKI